MKITKFLITIVLTTSLLSSCEEERLDILPVLSDPLETVIVDETSLNEMLIGGYDQMSSATLFGANLLIYGDLFSDNTFVSNTNDGYFFQENALAISTQTDLGFLGGLYKAIIYANIILNNTLQDTPVIQNIEGQAYAIRGLSLFYLVNLFSSNPTSGQYQEFGVPVYTGPYNPSENYPRMTVTEVYNQIIFDFEQALTNMNQPLNGPDSGNKSYLSPTAVKLLLSRVYLTRGEAGDYQKALDYANAVINTSPSQFGFVSSENYASYFSASDISLSEDQPETVWEINMTGADNPQLNSAISSFYHRTGAHASLLFRQDFYNSFNDGDIRKSLFSVAGAPTSDEPKGVWTTKWPRATSEGNFTINVKVLRMSEAKLNRIEALYHLGQTGTALTELNVFAASRGGDTYSGSDLLNDILTERRKEFFGEGQRFYDLKRNNLGYTKLTNCAGSVCTVEANSKWMVFPMPETSELLLNPLMTQHPLWQ